MMGNGELSIGSLLTAVLVLISAAALAYGWRQDRQLRRREYADRIRGAAGRIAALLERWPILARQFFDDLQPLVIEVGRMAACREDRAAPRHTLRKGLYEHRAAVARRIAEERLEAAYVDLYGYAPRIHELFLGAVERLKTIDAKAFRLVCEGMEHDLREQPPAPARDAPDLGGGVAPSLRDPRRGLRSGDIPGHRGVPRRNAETHRVRR